MPAPAEPRQRWRFVFRREAGAPSLGQREDLGAWESAMIATGLPIVGLDGPRARPRLLFGAPLPAGMVAERELADLYLTRRLTIDVVRPALIAQLPPGHVLVDLHDVWLGAPALPAQVVAAEYRARLGVEAPPAEAIAKAARRLLRRESLPRERAKGSGPVRYDLRPLLDDVAVVDPGPPVVLRIRTRFDQQLGTGRPDEVLAALAEVVGQPCPVDEVVRERLVLAGEG